MVEDVRGKLNTKYRDESLDSADKVKGTGSASPFISGVWTKVAITKALEISLQLFCSRFFVADTGLLLHIVQQAMCYKLQPAVFGIIAENFPVEMHRKST